MRLKTEIVVSALLRRVFASGSFGAIMHKGAEAAGAIFIVVRHRDGSETLVSPAPQTSFDEDDDGERKFEIRLKRAAADTVSDAIVRERKFDPDLWCVEVEAEDIETLVTIV